MTVVFDNLAAGTYAVGAYHDENNNDHLDTNVLGLPTEGYALSNGVRPVMSKPTFQQAAFTVGNAGAAARWDSVLGFASVGPTMP